MKQQQHTTQKKLLVEDWEREKEGTHCFLKEKL